MAAVPTIQGTAGNISVENVHAKFTGWTATIIGEEFPTTGFGDEGWQTGEVITGQIRGSAISVIGSGQAPLDAAFFATPCGVDTMKATILLTIAAGKTYSFEATYSAIELGRAETGAGSSTFRVDFASTGVVTAAWS